MGGGSAPRVREEHGRMLRDQLRAAYREALEEIPEEVQEETVTGAYYEVRLRPGSKPELLEKKRQHISLGASKIDDETDSVTAVIFIPHDRIQVVEHIFEDYAEGDLTPKGKPKRQGFVDPINTIRRARLQSFWTDDIVGLPDIPQQSIWWEVWCVPASALTVCEILQRMGCRVTDDEQWLIFPESTIIPVYARRADIELALILCEGIQELRRGTDNPTFFVEDERERQRDWIDNLAERIVWPPNDVPRVCLLDTGVNRAHPLIEPALAVNDLIAVYSHWSPTDNQRSTPHGTGMAGLALHGDLFPRLQDDSAVTLTHRLESVRILPDGDFPANEPSRYGSITLSGISLAETENPDQERIFCLATTNEDRSGNRGSSWSACLDRAAAGNLAGDEQDRPRRLICISAGNIRTMDPLAYGQPEDHPIEDPAQAWNVLTVGGYTEKSQLDQDDPFFAGYSPFANVGDVSPFSRNSLAWTAGKTPIKPDVVFEAGNRALSSAGTEVINCPSMELLTTGADVDRLPIDTFAATSAATAQAARLAARLRADHPQYWPETIRALIAHSAEWTDSMLERIDNGTGTRDRKSLLRTFGYGVPSYQRATASATSKLALVAQQEIQPYKKADGSIKLNECHYFELPWPADVLAEYYEQQFQLKVTLSYFVDPNPGRSAAIDPNNYQSFGLRFDLKRPLESLDQFKRRINQAERKPGARGESIPDSGRWVIGPKGISAGSLHCDVWTGTGAQLAARNYLCVKPISGWWKQRRNPEICEKRARYALVVTIAAPEETIDIYTPISTIIEQEVEIEI